MSHPVKGIVLCSGSASSLRFLHENDPAFGQNYQIVGVLSDNPEASGLTYATTHGIPTQVHNFEEWCKKANISPRDLVGRTAYFDQVLQLIAVWKPDFIILSGFMLIITDPLLTTYWGRILNVHPAWLSIKDDAGGRKYTGTKNVVARAMDAGDPTGSTVHLLTADPDMGPIVTESPALAYQPWDEPGAHQNMMKTACDGPAFQEALKTLIDAGWPNIPWQP
jgi:phosphoribosylglycinamide formyltransferase-1